MKDPILCECEECGDIALEAAYGGMKCSGCMLDVVDDPVVIDSVGRAIAALLQDVVREHVAKQGKQFDPVDRSDPKNQPRRTGEKMRAALDQGYGLAAFNERVRQKANGLKSPFVPSMTPEQPAPGDAAICDECVASDRIEAREAKKHKCVMCGGAQAVSQNMCVDCNAISASRQAGQAYIAKQYAMLQQQEGQMQAAAMAQQLASETHHVCSKCSVTTTHAASCGCGKCYGCCAI